jgi:hypothetical protein
MFDVMVVTELQQTGEAKTRKIFTGNFRPGLRQRRQFSVGRRQHDNIAGRLAQIMSVRAVVYFARLGGQKMH